MKCRVATVKIYSNFIVVQISKKKKKKEKKFTLLAATFLSPSACFISVVFKLRELFSFTFVVYNKDSMKQKVTKKCKNVVFFFLIISNAYVCSSMFSYTSARYVYDIRKTLPHKSMMSYAKNNRRPIFGQTFFFNPFMPSGLFYLVFGQVHFLYRGCLVSFYYYHVL